MTVRKTNTARPIQPGSAVLAIGPDTVTLRFATIGEYENKLCRLIDKRLHEVAPRLVSFDFHPALA